jgi:hypothetical protein
MLNYFVYVFNMTEIGIRFNDLVRNPEKELKLN